jgi:hypothetical protein
MTLMDRSIWPSGGVLGDIDEAGDDELGEQPEDAGEGVCESGVRVTEAGESVPFREG